MMGRYDRQIEQKWHDFIRYAGERFPGQAFRVYRDVFYAGVRAALRANYESRDSHDGGDHFERLLRGELHDVQNQAQAASDYERSAIELVFMSGGKYIVSLQDEIYADGPHKDERLNAIANEFNGYVRSRARGHRTRQRSRNRS